MVHNGKGNKIPAGPQNLVRCVALPSHTPFSRRQRHHPATMVSSYVPGSGIVPAVLCLAHGVFGVKGKREANT